MDFSLIDYLDEGACYTKLLELLHPAGLACPQCGEAHRLGIHRRHRDPVLDYQCGACGRVFNAWTGTQGLRISLGCLGALGRSGRLLCSRPSGRGSDASCTIERQDNPAPSGTSAP